MQKKLKKNRNECYYFVDGIKKIGVHEKIRGDVSGIIGNVSGIIGNVSGIRGNVSGIRGDVSGISGNVSGISGNVSDCEISSEERLNGVNINDLIDLDTEPEK